MGWVVALPNTTAARVQQARLQQIDRAFLLQAGYDGAVLFAPALDFPRYISTLCLCRPSPAIALAVSYARGS